MGKYFDLRVGFSVLRMRHVEIDNFALKSGFADTWIKGIERSATGDETLFVY
jgi:hypothetical protein